MNPFRLLKLLLLIFTILLIGNSGVNGGNAEGNEGGENSKHVKYEFIWTPEQSKYLVSLKNKYQLELKTSNCKNDLERVQVITNWVHHLWEHQGDKTSDAKDPASILTKVESGERFQCTEYALVIQGCLNSLGIPCRIIKLLPSNVETPKSYPRHVVAEAYLRDMNKWVFIDGQTNAIPIKNGAPLNAVEFQNAIIEFEASPELLSLSGVPKETYNQYLNWVYPFLYYFWVDLDQRIELGQKELAKEVILVPNGAKPPKSYRGKYQFKNVIYSNSLKKFYAPPNFSSL